MTEVPLVPAPRPGKPVETRRLPIGFRVRLGADVHRCADGVTLFGGTCGRIVRLKGAAPAMLGDDGVIEVRDEPSERLALLLSERGLAHPWWPEPVARQYDHQFTVVIPVLDRPSELDRLLASVAGGGARIIVVDDGSRDAEAIRRVADSHGAIVLRHDSPKGPSSARNTGLAVATTELVAFVDSDIVLGVTQLSSLARHFEDPRVGAAAPRILGLNHRGDAVTRYEAACSSLDLGTSPALVRPHSRVSYVPSATVMVRRRAVPDGFDSAMHVAEDVDLVWRLARDWHVRYDPAITVQHDHRTEPSQWLQRKVFYGSGAAPLATRHGDAVAPVVLNPWAAIASVALLAQRRWSLPVMAAATAVGFAGSYRTLRVSNTTGSPAQSARAAGALVALAWGSIAAQTSDAVIRHYVPLTVAALPFSGRARRAALTAGLIHGLFDWRRSRTDLDPVRFIALRTADRAGYGAGLWRGALAERSAAALRPAVRAGGPRRRHRPKQ